MSTQIDANKKQARKTGWLFNVAGSASLAACFSSGEGLLALPAILFFSAGITYFVKSTAHDES